MAKATNFSVTPRKDQDDIRQKVILYLSVQRFEAAEKILKASLSRDSKNAYLRNLLGLVYHQQSRFPEALREFKAAFKVNPSYLESALNLASTLCDLSRYDEASEVFIEARKHIHTELKIPLLIVGRLANRHAQNGIEYFQAELYDLAQRELERALELRPQMVDVRLLLSKIFLQEKKPDLAKAHLEMLLSFDKENADGLALLGLVHHQLGRPELAKDLWKDSTRLDAANLSAKILLRFTQSEPSTT